MDACRKVGASLCRFCSRRIFAYQKRAMPLRGSNCSTSSKSAPAPARSPIRRRRRARRSSTSVMNACISSGSRMESSCRFTMCSGTSPSSGTFPQPPPLSCIEMPSSLQPSPPGEVASSVQSTSSMEAPALDSRLPLSSLSSLSPGGEPSRFSSLSRLASCWRCSSAAKASSMARVYCRCASRKFPRPRMASPRPRRAMRCEGAS
mmetsp:Transcript_20727/g.44207  ORF Transcript_20727/g.44207 Transcript_20727/m.44207 type:complete len:205 (+) Transcript_20727:2728-3342(+)